MEFETIVYVKDYEEIAEAFISKTLVTFFEVFAVILLILYTISAVMYKNFFEVKAVSMLIFSLVLFLFSNRYQSRMRRSMRKRLEKMSAGQRKIILRYSLRNQYVFVQNVNTGEKDEFQISNVVVCKETRLYYIYFLRDKRVFFVRRSMICLDVFKRMFQPKKYYDLRNNK